MLISKGYKQNKIDTSKMFEMAEAGKVDIGKLNLDLLHALLKKCGLSDEEIANIAIKYKSQLFFLIYFQILLFPA